MNRTLKGIESKNSTYRELLLLEYLDEILKELKKLNKVKKK